MRKGPKAEIEEIERAFKREIPGLESIIAKEVEIGGQRIKKGGETWKAYLLVAVISMLFGGVIISSVFIFTPTWKFEKGKVNIAGEKKKEAGKTSDKEDKERTSEKRKKVSCVVKVQFDSEIAETAYEHGISDFRINTEKKTEKVVRFYIGDFVNVEDTAFVSARLNEKGIPNSISHKNNRWRVYISIKKDEISKMLSSPEGVITEKKLEALRRLVEKKTGEIVNAEIEEEEEIISIAVFEFEKRDECEKFFSIIKTAGKNPKIELYIEAKLTKSFQVSWLL